VPIDDFRLYTTLRSIQSTLSFDEAGAIIDIARLAAVADGKTTVDEMGVIVMLRRIITELAGGRVPHPSVAIDASRLAAISNELVSTGPRELAFACALLVMMHDLELTAEERDLATELAHALVLEPARAKAIATEIESVVRDEQADRPQ
jgi:tellurite resistance protein